MINKIIKIDTQNTTLLLNVNETNVEILHYGPKINHVTDNDYKILSVIPRKNNRAAIDDFSTELHVISYFGDGNSREKLLELSLEDGYFNGRFIFDRFEVLTEKPKNKEVPTSHGAKETIAIYFKDKVNNLDLVRYYSTFLNCDTIASSTRLVNNSTKSITLNRLMSNQIDFNGDDFEIITLNGMWGNERNRNVSKVTTGIYVSESRAGVSSNRTNPYFMIRNNGESKGVYGFNLIYSGSHKAVVETTSLGVMRILNGINDYLFSMEIKPGAYFLSPEAIMTYAINEGDLTHQQHLFVNNHIISENKQFTERPILLNNWEATYFDFNEKKLLDIASSAANVGIEMFVLDDGWFGKRNSDTCSLGDWVDNESKTGGLKKLSDNIRAKGLKFGIWVEPEMISPDSELYKKHPEFALMDKNIEPWLRRNQLLLDMANPKVQENIIEQMTKLFELCNPDYVKWDYNRLMLDVKSDFAKNVGTYHYQYMVGIYKVMQTLTAKYPNILFEGCSGGGNRFDLGILCYMPQIWASDNSDARERLRINEGTLYGYPQSTLGSHVSAIPNHQTGCNSTLSDRFNVASAGMLGYELDLTKCTDIEIQEIKEQVSFYKKHRKLFQYGDYALLSSVYEGNFAGWITTSQDKSKAIAVLVQQNYEMNRNKPKFRLKNLDSSKKYSIKICENNTSFVASGDILNHGALDLCSFFGERNDKYSNSISTIMLEIKEIGMNE